MLLHPFEATLMSQELPDAAGQFWCKVVTAAPPEACKMKHLSQLMGPPSPPARKPDGWGFMSEFISGKNFRLNCFQLSREAPTPVWMRNVWRRPRFGGDRKKKAYVAVYEQWQQGSGFVSLSTSQNVQDAKKMSTFLVLCSHEIKKDKHGDFLQWPIRACGHLQRRFNWNFRCVRWGLELCCSPYLGSSWMLHKVVQGM